MPETNAPACRTHEHCREWVKLGAKVTVITCFPNFPHGKVYEGYKNKLYDVEHIDGIKVVRVWSYMAENKGFIKRTLDFLSYMCASFIAGLFIKTDIIIATSPQFFTAISGRWLAFWKRKKFVLEIRDLWPESIKVVGAMKDNLVLRYFEFLEHRLYKAAWKIVTVTAYMKQLMVNKHHIPEEKIAVYRNGVDFDKFFPLAKDEALIKRLELKEKFVIGYIGTHGMAHALDFVLRSARHITNVNVHFLFVGSGAAKAELLKLAEEFQLKNVTFIDAVSKEEVKRYISILDMGLVNLRDSTIFEGALPSKMNELAAMNIPILLGVRGEAQDFVKTNQLGLFFEPENEASFLKAIAQATEHRDNYNFNQEQLKTIIERKEIAKNMLGFVQA